MLFALQQRTGCIFRLLRWLRRPKPMGEMRRRQAAAALKQALESRGAAGGDVGLGIVAMDSFDDASAWLKARRAPPWTRPGRSLRSSTALLLDYRTSLSHTLCVPCLVTHCCVRVRTHSVCNRTHSSGGSAGL